MDSILNKSGHSRSANQNELSNESLDKSNPFPALFYLALAGGAVALSFGLAMSKKRKNWSGFVGQWVPTILLLGIYDKVMKKEDVEQVKTKTFLH